MCDSGAECWGHRSETPAGCAWWPATFPRGVSAHDSRAQTRISATLQESNGSPPAWEYHLSEFQVQTPHFTSTKSLMLVFRGPGEPGTKQVFMRIMEIGVY